MTRTPISVNSIDGMDIVFAESAENDSTQHQLIAPPNTF